MAEPLQNQRRQGGGSSLRFVEERDDCSRKFRTEVDVVMRESRQDREAMMRHPRAVPVGVTFSATQPAEELDRVRRRHPSASPATINTGIDSLATSADQS